jgi:hypothetical protein
MRTEQYHANRLVELLRGRKIATMPELKAALKTEVDGTVFRKLKEVSYRTSYSHGGSFYTLDEIAEFDAMGLWSHRSVHFSAHGNLLSTLEAFVLESEAGHFVSELENLLQVGVKESLLQLVRRERIAREKMVGLYLYCARDPSVRKRQILARAVQEAQPGLGGVALGRIVPDELKAAIVLFFSVLDEKQRRLYAGLESLKFGHGGDEKIAELLGLDVRTIARGRCQLMERDLEVERVRKVGGGRKPLEKKRRK